MSGTGEVWPRRPRQLPPFIRIIGKEPKNVIPAKPSPPEGLVEELSEEQRVRLGLTSWYLQLMKGTQMQMAPSRLEYSGIFTGNSPTPLAFVMLVVQHIKATMAVLQLASTS